METTFTWAQVQELIKTAIATAVAESNKLNPIEQRKFDEEIGRERRRNMMMVELGKIEEASAKRRRSGCSHLRYPANAGKLAGHGAPPGTSGAEWTTAGQAYQNGTAALMCQRCQSIWLFRPAPEYLADIRENGMLGIPPPEEQNVLCIGCFEYKSKCRCDEIAAASRAGVAVAVA
jgi:hypothetical protein